MAIIEDKKCWMEQGYLEMIKKTKLTSMIGNYLRRLLVLGMIFFLMSSTIYFIHPEAGTLAYIYSISYILFAIAFYCYKRPLVSRGLIQFATGYGQVQKQLVKELQLPFSILDLDGKLLWGNDAFLDLVCEKEAKKGISYVFSELTKEQLYKLTKELELHIAWKERSYRLVLQKVYIPAFSARLQPEQEQEALLACYLYDETETIKYKEENQKQRLIVGLLYIDNYEEGLETIDEIKQSLLSALIERKINKYMQNLDAIVKKLEKDKYIVVFQQRYLSVLQENKFSLLDEVKAINIGNDVPITISIGIGANGESYLKNYDFARAAMDLALGRGGDQAVVKEGEKIFYYGGKSVQVEKNTRVKARVKAHALKELIEAKDRVLIMGHAIGDVDSLGAAIGIYRIAKTLNKRANIVFNEVTTSVKPMFQRFLNHPDYEEDLFFQSEQAKNSVNANTLLVVVDVNRPSYTECEALLNECKTIVLLDHHRKSKDAIANAVLSYIEPYASSTCEMVAEVLQYIEGVKLKPVEADAIYAGIMVDTNNFLTKAGVRTFEAAAFLRRNGADITRVRKLFRNELEEIQLKSEAIQKAEIYLDYYAITECPSIDVKSPTVLGAQVANELLEINGVKASFVLTAFREKVYISARSIDELNVQLVMERLGGGGHLSVAGAQMLNCTIEEAIMILKSTLNRMKEEGDL